MKKHVLAAMSLTLVSFMSQAENVASDPITAPENATLTNTENNTQMDSRSNTETNEVDNTEINKRDRDERTVTPMDQSNNQADLDITQAIRKSLMDQELSTNAKNIKVITQNGDVTLRGPVNNSAELEKVAALAKAVPGIKTLHNELEVK